MATLRYIQGLSGAGFRVKDNAGAWKRVKEGVTIQVDIDDRATQLILNGERDNFIRVAASGSTTATIVGLTRYGFRIPESSDGAYKVCKIGTSVTVDLTKGVNRRILRRNYGRYIVTSSTTSATIRGTQEEQIGFDVSAQAAATAVLSSDGTVPTAGETVTINDKTYRFETTLAAANDVKIGATSDATLDSLVKAVNQTGVAGTDYFAGTTAPTGVTASARTGTGATGQVTFTATTPGTAGNAFASTETSAHLSFGAATFTGGAQTGVLTKVYKLQSATVDPSQPTVYGQIRRHYKSWVEA